MRQTRHEGRKASARFRQWQELVSLARELWACVHAAEEADTLPCVLSDYLTFCQVELREVLCQASWLADRIWRDGSMAAYTVQLCSEGGR